MFTSAHTTLPLFIAHPFPPTPNNITCSSPEANPHATNLKNSNNKNDLVWRKGCVELDKHKQRDRVCIHMQIAIDSSSARQSVEPAEHEYGSRAYIGCVSEPDASVLNSD